MLDESSTALLESIARDQDIGRIAEWSMHCRRLVESSIKETIKEHSSKYGKLSKNKNQLMENPTRNMLRDDAPYH